MPFTFSHPAIVLPLTCLSKRWFSLTALVIGSITPDFEYFFRMRIEGIYGHTLPGIVWFDLPVGIMLAYTFHYLVRNSFIDNLPFFLRSRFSAFKQFNWHHHFKKNAWVICISFIIGAASHIFWDAFTHEHGYFINIIPGSKNTIRLFDAQVPVFKIVQHISTLAGALVIVFAVIRMPATENSSQTISLKYWLSFGCVTLFIALLRFATANSNTVGSIIVTIISSGLISLLLTSLPEQLKTFKNSPPA